MNSYKKDRKKRLYYILPLIIRTNTELQRLNLELTTKPGTLHRELKSMTQEEQISIFDMFKIGIGPSSSHTLGPWKAAQLFLKSLTEKKMLTNVSDVKILFYGSLAKTGRGHGTDIAVQLGLCGYDVVTFDVNSITPTIQYIFDQQKLKLDGIHTIAFNPATAIDFRFTESLPFHPNALTFIATTSDGKELNETYYSVGGGFVVKDGEDNSSNTNRVVLKYPIETSAQLLKYCDEQNLSVSQVVVFADVGNIS